MRIEAYTQVQQLYNSSQVQKAQGVRAKGPTDQVQISNSGLDYQVTTATLKSVPDIRTDVCDPLKKAVADGTYDVSNESFAEKLMKKYAELG